MPDCKLFLAAFNASDKSGGFFQYKSRKNQLQHAPIILKSLILLFLLRDTIRTIMKIKIVNHSNNQLPTYATPQSAGLDLRANLTEPIILQPLERCLVPTGLRIALPQGYEAQVRPRSGLALKHGITLLNTPGTIDADYRGEIGVIMVNLSNEPFEIKHGERIAQLVIARFEQAEWDVVESLDETLRGEGGFGHTGKE